MQVTKKCSPGRTQKKTTTTKRKIKSSIQLNFLHKVYHMSLHLKNYSNRTFLCWKTNISVLYSLKGKKYKFVRINLLVELFFVSVCVFLKQKIYILIHIRLMCAGRWKNISTRPTSGNETIFFFFLVLRCFTFSHDAPSLMFDRVLNTTCSFV